jgi:hypothetical protein
MRGVTPTKMGATFEKLSRGALEGWASAEPVTWEEFSSSLGLTTQEMEELSWKNSSWKRLINLYKQKCKATQIAVIKKDPKALLELFKLEFGNDYSINLEEEEWGSER